MKLKDYFKPKSAWSVDKCLLLMAVSIRFRAFMISVFIINYPLKWIFCPYSWQRCTKLLWWVCAQKATGVQTSTPWFSTTPCSPSYPAPGTGSDSTRLADQHQLIGVSVSFSHSLTVFGFQVGFSSVSDYITYTWVKDDEVAINEEMMQVAAEGACGAANSQQKCLQCSWTILSFPGVHE